MIRRLEDIIRNVKALKESNIKYARKSRKEYCKQIKNLYNGRD